MINLRANILATLAYYDVFDFPLKDDEVFRFLINFQHLEPGQLVEPPSRDNVKIELRKLVEEKTVGSADGFYFLFDHEYSVPLRLKHETLARRKIKKTIRAVKWLLPLPYIKGIFASGSLAMSNTNELSDLDVLVVVKYGRVWLARLLIMGVLSLLGIRRRGMEKISPDKICLNHYITDEYLNIPFKSIYNAETYANLLPIYMGESDLVTRFKEENPWVLDFVFRWANIDTAPLVEGGHAVRGVFRKAGEFILDSRIGDLLEKFARKFQFSRIDRNPASKQSGGRVVFNDRQLEFHPGSIEKDILAKYNQKLADLGLGYYAVEKDSGLR